ncbi:MAG: UvrD-helicase domain-containing protein, partial [Bacteroidales bacterium]
MKFIADLHIHSHFSMATSKKLTPEYLDYWAKLKGIKIIGTGDFSHPGWTAELKEKIEPAESGLFKLKEDYKLKSPIPENEINSPRFLLSAEISNIYKKNEKVRKIHNVILAPDFDVAEKMQRKLASMNFNITSDGRPILGLDAKYLLEICLDISEDILFIPAHIWTPWFSALGSKSGFNKIEECFDDLSNHIYALETGLSTDPALNWMCSFLDKYTLISNSDAHSPEKLGRNANIFDTDVNYFSIIDALKTGDKRFAGTFDMFPQEGKYHYDGHRKCNICWSPVETLKHHHICPACGKKVTVGVVNRIAELSDRTNIENRPNRKPFYSIIPLKEILGEISGVGENSKKVKKWYEHLVTKAGSEFNILHFLHIDQVKAIGGDVLSEAIQRMRNNQIIIKEGFDGEFGEIKVFRPDESKIFENKSALFEISDLPEIPKRKLLNFDLSQYQKLKTVTQPADVAAEPHEYYNTSEKKGILQGLNAEQTKAVSHTEGPALVLAGPGTGKTNVLTRRIAFLIEEKKVNPENILAVTFTNQAADEMLSRTKMLLNKNDGINDIQISTFHALGYSVLKDYCTCHEQIEILNIIDENDKQFILNNLFTDKSKTEIKQYSKSITEIKQQVIEPEDIKDDDKRFIFTKYCAELQKNNLFDLDDMIYQPVILFEEDETLLNKYKNRFQWIMIDEFQDINHAQYKLIQAFTDSKHSNICVIGDPNQAIYGFRGSNTRYISRFIEDFPHTDIYKLNLSYRCTNNILKASGNILKGYDLLQGLDDGIRIKISAQQT